MSTKYYEGAGGIWMPERTISRPGAAVMPERAGVVVATIRRPRWSIEDIFKLPDEAHPDLAYRERVRELLSEAMRELDRSKFTQETIWLSITHNERVDDGAGIQFNRTLGTVGAAAAVAANVAVANAAITALKTHRSIQSTSQSVTTNEFTTIGLSRALGTPGNYVAPASLNAVASADVVKSFSVSGSGTGKGSALFDSATPAGSLMYVEDNFSSDAVVVSGDTLQITWTITM